MQLLPPFFRFLGIYLRAGSPKLAIALLDEGESQAGLWPPLLQDGKKLLKRRFDFAGCSIEIPGRIIWQSDQATPQWYENFYSFRWLQEISSAQNQKLASSLGREFVYEYTLNQAALPAEATRPNVTGQRIASWLSHRYFLLKGGSLKFRTRFIRQLMRETRILHRDTMQENYPSALALHGLISAATVFRPLKPLLPEYLERLEHALKHQILPDGMHLSRNPSQHLRLLISLLEIHHTLTSQQVESEVLLHTIQRMSAMLLLLQHGDGRLGLFNGNLMEDAALMARAVTLAGVSSPAFSLAVHSGFFRLEHQGVTLLMAGRSAFSAPEDCAYQGSFEFSDHGARMVVNCGAFHGKHAAWAEATRQSSAYSVLSLHHDQESTHLLISSLVPPEKTSDAQGGLKLAENLLEKRSGVTQASCETLLEMPHGMLTYRREISLSQQGNEIRGIDSLTPQGELQSPRYVKPVIRFHLHPDVRFQQTGEKEVTLTSVKAVSWAFTVNEEGSISNIPKGASWKFSLESDAKLQIEESVYLGYYGKPQKTMQIVVTPDFILPKTEIVWKFVKTIK